MLSLLCLFAFVNPPIEATCPDFSSKLVANYEFTERHYGYDSTTANSAVDKINMPAFNMSGGDWLPHSIGVHLNGNKELALDSKLDMRNIPQFSFEIWYRSSGEGIIVGLDDGQGSGCSMNYCDGSKKLSLLQGCTSNYVVSEIMRSDASDPVNCRCTTKADKFISCPPKIFTDTTIHQMVYTIDTSTTYSSGSPTINLYHNGVLNTDINDYGSLFSTDPSLQFAEWGEIDVILAPYDAGKGRYWSGEIFKIAFYNSALTSAEVTETYNNCLPNSMPFVRDFTQHVPEDISTEIILGNSGTSPKKIDTTQYDTSKIPSLLNIYVLSTNLPPIYDIDDHIFDFEIKSVPGQKIDSTSVLECPGIKVADCTFGGIVCEGKMKPFFSTEIDGVSYTIDNLMGKKFDRISNLIFNYQSFQDDTDWWWDATQTNNEWITDVSYFNKCAQLASPFSSFSYRVFDGKNWSNFGTVTIIVDPRKDPPVANDLDLKVKLGDQKPVQLVAEKLKDQFIGDKEYRINEVKITKAPQFGKLSHCGSGCGEACIIADDFIVSKLDFCGCDNAGIDCNAEIKCDVDEGMFCLKYATTENSSVDVNDIFRFQMIASSPKDEIFNLAARTGNIHTATIIIENPLDATGVAGTCVVEDEKSILTFSYQPEQNADQYNITIKIFDLPTNFKGTLFIGDEEFQGETDFFKPDEKVVQYQTFKNAESTNDTVPFQISGQYMGIQFNSSRGEQIICVEPRNDLAEIHTITFKDGVDCCLNNATCNLIPSEGDSIVNFPNNGDQILNVIKTKCVLFKVDWEDVDPSGATYKLTLEGPGEGKIVFTLPQKVLVGSGQVNIGRIIGGTPVQNSNKIVMEGDYEAMRILLGAHAQSSDDYLTLKGQNNGKHTITIKIEDTSKNQAQNIVGTSVTKQIDVNVEASGSSNGKSDGPEKISLPLFDVEIEKKDFIMYVIIASIICLCMCFCCIFIFWKIFGDSPDPPTNMESALQLSEIQRQVAKHSPTKTESNKCCLLM